MTRIDGAYTAEEAKKCFIKLKNGPLQKRNKETGLEFGPPAVCIRSCNIFSKRKKQQHLLHKSYGYSRVTKQVTYPYANNIV